MQKVVRYEDTFEGQHTANLVFTTVAAELYRELTVTVPVLKKISRIADIEKCNIRYETGILRPDNETTVICSTEQMHIIVAYNVNTKTYIGIGLMTSEESRWKLADTLEISGNVDKKQYFRPFTSPLLAKKEDFELVKTNN